MINRNLFIQPTPVEGMLKENERLVYKLRVIDGRPGTEVAEMIGYAPESISRTLRRAKLALKPLEAACEATGNDFKAILRHILRDPPTPIHVNGRGQFRA
jgi:hypothetical protein